MFLHNTIRKYTLALLDFFNEIEVQHENSEKAIITKKVPIQYRNREKGMLMDKSWKQQITGNMNVLPLGSLTLTGISKNTDRITSKFNRFTKRRADNEIEYMFNPVPYDFSFEVSYICRGMNEACQLIEEICPKFNPNVAIDIYDSENQDEPSRIPVKLTDVSCEQPSFEELSANVIHVTFNIELNGWLFPPIKDYSKIKEYYVNLNTPNKNTTVMHFDVIDGSPVPPPTITKTTDLDTNLYINPLRLSFVDNKVIVSYESNAKENPSIRFISSDCIINETKANYCLVSKKLKSEFTICAILELNNVSSSIQKTFTFNETSK